MIKNALQKLYLRDLQTLKEEIHLYPTDKHLWTIADGITNSGGNLCLHLIGNLKTYIGSGLAATDYVRDRSFEFSGSGLTKVQLISEIEETMVIVTRGLASLTDEQLELKFPIKIWEEETDRVFTLLHLHSHLNYHLGQINYHRRLLGKDN